MTADLGKNAESAPLLDRGDERVAHAAGIGGTLRAFFNRVRSGDLGSLPVVVGLAIIWTVFQTLNPVFLSPDNLVNLLFDCSTVGVIALGIVCILMVGEIDLSVGSVSGEHRSVTLPQPRVPALLDVACRPAEAADEEIAQTDFRSGHVVGRIHRPQDVVARDLRVEGAHEPREPLLADAIVDLEFVHHPATVAGAGPASDVGPGSVAGIAGAFMRTPG